MTSLRLGVLAALVLITASVQAAERPPLRFSVASLGWEATDVGLERDASRPAPWLDSDVAPIRLRDGPTGRVAQAGFRRQIDDATEFTAGPTWKPEDGADIRVLIGFRRALN